MKTHLLGFRVTATPPPKGGRAPRTDHFELRQSAIECAIRARAAGWRNVRAFIVTREAASDGEWLFDEELAQIWPEPGSDAEIGL